MNQFLETHRQTVLLVLMALLAGPFLWVLKPFWITIILGLVFSVALEPAHVWLERKMKGHSNWALALLMTAVIFLCVLPFGLVLVKGANILFSQLKNLGQPESMDRLKSYQDMIVQRLAPLRQYGVDPSVIEDQVWSTAQKAGGFLTNTVGSAVAQIPEALLLLFVLVLSIISFISMKYAFKKAAMEARWLSPEGRATLIVKFKICCKSVMVSTFVAGFAQSVLTTIGAIIFTDYDWILIFFVTFLLSFIPVIGAGPVAFVLGLAAFAQNDWGNGVGLVVVSGLTGILDNILRPVLLAGTTEVPSIWALFCTLGAIIMMGLPGLFIGPLIGSMTIEMLPVLMEEYKRKP